jgi:serine/threonine-protein kinase HipA
MSNICPITYEKIEDNGKYSKYGLKQLSPRLNELNDLNYTTEQQITEAKERANKLSIQGVQPKLSAKLNVKEQSFELCDVGGTFILKPQHRDFDQLPENEDLTMHLASYIIEVPLHGLIYSSDGQLTYFIKRFDRLSRGNKLPVEDFSQLSSFTRATKYNSSMENISATLDKFCTFPQIEKVKLFYRVLFNYLIGNEDMHLKNYSLITKSDIVSFAPAYDLINTSLAIGINKVKEQIALPLNGKKNNLTKKDLIDYYARNRLQLNNFIIDKTLNDFSNIIPKWYALIDTSFLTPRNREGYKSLVKDRASNLGLVT